MTATATGEDFELLALEMQRLASVALDLGQPVPASLILMGGIPVHQVRLPHAGQPLPAEEVSAGTAGVRLLRVPMGVFLSEPAGRMGRQLIAAVLQGLAQHPEITVLGFMAEAWLSRRPPDNSDCAPDTASRQEVLMLTLLSAECQALQLCPITRVEGRGVLAPAPLLFDTEGQGLRSPYMRPRKILN